MFSELLNECKEKPYRTHLLSCEYSHHVYTKASTLAYSFHELGDESSRIAFVNSAIVWHCGSRWFTLRPIKSHTILDRIICLLYVYICHYIFPFYYLDIYFILFLFSEKMKIKNNNKCPNNKKEIYNDNSIKRASYPFGIISLAHAPVNVTDFSIGSINCVRHFPQA